MTLNLNVGILGHVDSGKTTLARVLSDISSTASFDKNPQSQERGITLDLGFSAYCCDLPEHLSCTSNLKNISQLQFTFVDCPGHAKLIRTIIGGAQIIDIMILVIDIQKGIQTQTAECLVIGELTCQQHLLVVLNKIDLLEPDKKHKTIDKLTKKLRTILHDTNYSNVIIHSLSATTQENVPEFVDILKQTSYQPQRTNSDLPFLMAVDHCFMIKGQGTVCTGTVLQGAIKVNDSIEIPNAKLCKKIKSIQMFRTSISTASQGDRIGICITQFDPKLLERGLLAHPNYLTTILVTVIRLNVIKYYKGRIRSKSKFHVNIGHEMTMAKCTLFTSKHETFNINDEYEYLEEYDENIDKKIFCLLEFEKPIIAAPTALLIAAKLDMDANTTQCRIAFWGRLNETEVTNAHNPSIIKDNKQIHIFKEKTKQGQIQRIVNEQEIIVDHLFKKESNREIFIGMPVTLSTGEFGYIESTFGTTSKVKVRLPNGLTNETLDKIKDKKMKDMTVVLKFRKFLNDKNKISS